MCYRRSEDSIRPRPAGNMKTLQQLTGPGEVRTEVHVWLTRNPNNEPWLCIDHASVFLTLWKLLGAQNCLAIVHHTYEVLKVLVNVLCSRHYFLKFCIVYFRCVQVWERRLSKCLCVCHPTLISVCCEYTYTASHLQPGWFLEPNAEFFPELGSPAYHCR